MEEIIKPVMETLQENYMTPIWEIVNMDDNVKRSLPGFLLNPDKVIFYLGKNYLAIEYVGVYNKQIVNGWNVETAFFDYSDAENFIEQVVGVSFDGTGIPVPIMDEIDDFFVATTGATEILTNNNWNFLAQEMMFMLNCNGVRLIDGGPKRIRNSFFYTKSNEGLKVRNIQWMEIFPIERVDLDDDNEEIKVTFWPNIYQMALRDSQYTIPEKFNYQYEKLIILNRFIELYNSDGVSETDITRFLSHVEHQFILKMAFFGQQVNYEKECEWVGDSEKDAIRPDYFITGANGSADIVEFKLPTIKTESAIVGRNNRETFSAELHSYIAQTRVYSEYFEDPRNREHVNERYNINVYKPRRFLVVGRRWMFPTETWRSIESDYPQITIRTYDDIVDTVMGYLTS